MSAGGRGPDGPPPPRLDPFAFPSDTAFRFLLLIVSVAGISLFLSNWLYFSLSDRHDEVVRSLACTNAHRVSVLTAVEPDQIAAANRTFTDCIDAINRPKGEFMLGGIALLAATAVTIFLCLPAVKLRRRRLVAFTAEDSAEVAAEIDRLAARCGLHEPPKIVWNPLDPAPTGLAFGRPGRRYVAVTGGLVVLHATDPPAFRAILLHELAHLRNRDVDATYFTMAIWYAFLVAGIAPFLPTLLDESADTIAALAWRLAALVGLVYLSRNSVLRARESYADLRAESAEPAGALRRVLRSLPDPPARAFERLLAKHPRAGVRAEVLDSTDRLFALGTIEAFGAGVAATIAYQEVTTLLGFAGLEALSTWWISALVFAPLAVGVVGLGAWRAAFAAMARDRWPAGGWRLGAALGAGLLAGQELSLSSVISKQDVVLSTADPANVVWAAVAVVGLGAFVAWLVSAAATWLPVAGRRSPRRALLAAFLAGSLVLTLGLGLFLFAHETRAAIHFSTHSTATEYRAVNAVVWPGPEALYQFVRDPELALYAHRPLVWLGVLALWAFPLAAVLLRRRAGPPSWGWLDAGGVALRQPRVALARALVVGAAGAACVLVAVLILRLSVHAAVSVQTRERPEFLVAFYVWTVLLALIGQGVAAAVTAAMSRTLAVPLALLSAFVTGLGGAVSVAALPSLASCVTPLEVRGAACAWSLDRSFARFTLEQMVVDGALVALVFAAAGCAGAAAWRARAG